MAEPFDVTKPHDTTGLPSSIQQDGYGVRADDKNYKVWNSEGNGVSLVDRYTAKLLAEAGTGQEVDPRLLDSTLAAQGAHADEESMHHPRLSSEFPYVKGWEGSTAAFLHGAGEKGSLGLSNLLEAAVLSKGTQRQFKANDQRHYIAKFFGDGTGYLNPAYYGAGAAGKAAYGVVAAAGAAEGATENIRDQLFENGHVDPWQVTAAGTIDAVVQTLAHGVGEKVLNPALRGARTVGGKFLNRVAKAYPRGEDKVIYQKVAKTAEEIAAGEAAMNKPYTSQVKTTVHGGGVKTVEAEDVAREVVEHVQKGMSPEEAIDTAGEDALNRARQARGKVKVTKTRVKKDTGFTGVVNKSTDAATDAEGGTSSQTITEGGKSQVTNTERRVEKSKGSRLEFDNNMPPPRPDGIHDVPQPPPRPKPDDIPDATADAQYVKPVHDMTDAEIYKHIEDLGSHDHPDAVEAIRELKQRAADKEAVRKGIQKAADHFHNDSIGNRLVSHEPFGNEPPTWHFPEGMSDEAKKRKVGEWFERILSPEDNALHKQGQHYAREFHRTGETAYHDAWAAINAHLTRKYPRRALDKIAGGEIVPSFRDLSNHYRVLNGYTEGGPLTKVTGHVGGEGGNRPPRGPNEPPPLPRQEPFAVNEKRRFEGQTTDTRTKTETVTKYPKPPKFSKHTIVPVTVPGKYSAHFSKQGAAATALGARVASHIGVPLLGHLAMPAIAADYGMAALLNRKAAVGRVLLKYGMYTTKGIGETLKVLTKEYNKEIQDYVGNKTSDRQISAGNVAEVDSQFDTIYNKGLNRAVADPKAVEAVVQNQAGHALPPANLAHYVQTALLLANKMQESYPKDPRPPTLRHSKFNPPHSAKVKALQDYHAVVNPIEGLKNPTPRRVQMIEAVHPELMKQVRDGLTGYLSQNEGKLTPKQERNISIIMGAPVTARYEQGYIQRMQMGAADKPQQDQTAGASAGKHPSINGGKSAKITAQSALIDSPDPNVNTLQ